MRVVIVNTQSPFVRGGAEIVAENLRLTLEERGHNADLVRIPIKEYPPEAMLEHMLACRLLQLDAGAPDLLIALKFPVYYARFHRKKLWLFHQERQIYDLWGTHYQWFPDTPEGLRVRDAVIHADNQYLPEAQEIYTLSRNVANRLKTYNNIDATGVLYPPLYRPDLYRQGRSDDYFVYPSRLTGPKRQSLAVEAMRHVRSPFRLLLVGPPDSPDYRDQLENLIRTHGLEDRVEMTGWVSEEQKVELLANCLAVIFVPYDEDFGFVTIEAFHSRKAVICCTDSGGPGELVEHGRSGLIVEPTPEALAEAMERLWNARQQAIEMGLEAYDSLARLGITWDHVLDRLLS